MALFILKEVIIVDSKFSLPTLVITYTQRRPWDRPSISLDWRSLRPLTVKMSGALNQAPHSVINVVSVARVFIRQKYNWVFKINKMERVDKISVAVTKEELFEKGPVVIKMEEYLKAAARWPVSFLMGMEGC